MENICCGEENVNFKFGLFQNVSPHGGTATESEVGTERYLSNFDCEPSNNHLALPMPGSTWHTSKSCLLEE